MADESVHLPIEQNIDYYILTLFERLETMRRENNNFGLHANFGGRNAIQPKRSMQAEIRTLEFWRSIICECLASFFYVFIVCGAAAGAGVGASVSSVLLATALASGLAIATLTQCFKQISGAHINPSITLGACVIRVISPLRAAMYITAQCGGGIAGAALLYGVTVPGYQGNLQAAISHSSALAAWERFGVEFILTFIVVLTYFVSMDSYKKYFGNASLAVGAAYSACSFVSMPYLNPARSLGPSFVLNKWDNHWVYWFGPLVGGAASALIYEYVFNSRRSQKRPKENMEHDSLSIQSEDDLNYDVDIEKPSILQNPKLQGSSTYRASKGHMNRDNGLGYCQNFYTTTPPTKFEQPEPLYGGTRSMYCRSPPLTRANLNRSQSVYAKSQTAINRDIVQRPGPLVPAQSLYPIRVTQQAQSSHLQNQNVQNQMQQRSESIYGGMRASSRSAMGTQQQNQNQNQNQHQHQQQPPQQQQQQHQQQIQMQHPPPHQQSERTQDSQRFQPVYGTRQNPTPNENMKFDSRTLDSKDHRSNRPESMYGMSVGQRGRGQSAQSDDSSYGSYHGSAATPPARNPNAETLNYPPPGNSGQIRTQSERKVSANVSSNNGNTQPAQLINGDRQNPVNYTTQNQASMYGLLPMRHQN